MKVKITLCLLVGICLVSSCTSGVKDSRNESFSSGLPSGKTEPITEEQPTNTLKLQAASLNDSDYDGVIDMRDNCRLSSNENAVDNEGCAKSYGEVKTIDIVIQFDVNSAMVKEEYNEQLEHIASLYDAFHEHVLLIEGYSDNTGSNKMNMSLSKERAESVAKILIKKFGMNKNNILVVGFGSKNAIADNSTADGRKKNRRMVVHLASKKRIMEKKWDVWSMELGDKKSEVKEYYRLLD